MPSLSRRNIFSLLAAPLLPRVKGTVNDTVVAGTLPEIWHDPDDLQTVRYREYRIAELRKIAAGTGIRYEDLLRDLSCSGYTSR